MKAWREKVVVFLHVRVPWKKSRKGKLKEIHLYEDSRSSNLVILEALEKYRVKTVDILPPKKECGGKTDWRESLTFKQALYPYRVGEDMHNPSKMHMNFPSSNSSRLNSSQWINYEYCMYWIAEDQIEFIEKKTQIYDIKISYFMKLVLDLGVKFSKIMFWVVWYKPDLYGLK